MGLNKTLLSSRYPTYKIHNGEYKFGELMVYGNILMRCIKETYVRGGTPDLAASEQVYYFTNDEWRGVLPSFSFEYEILGGGRVVSVTTNLVGVNFVLFDVFIRSISTGEVLLHDTDLTDLDGLVLDRELIEYGEGGGRVDYEPIEVYITPKQYTKFGAKLPNPNVTQVSYSNGSLLILFAKKSYFRAFTVDVFNDSRFNRYEDPFYDNRLGGINLPYDPTAGVGDLRVKVRAKNPTENESESEE